MITLIAGDPFVLKVSGVEFSFAAKYTVSLIDNTQRNLLFSVIDAVETGDLKPVDNFTRALWPVYSQVQHGTALKDVNDRWIAAITSLRMKDQLKESEYQLLMQAAGA